MIQGRWAVFGGMTALAALGVAGVSFAQPVNDLPPVDHAPFAGETPSQVPARAYLNGQTGASSSGAWLLHMARPGRPEPRFGFGPQDPGGLPSWSAPPLALRDMPNGRADRGLAAPPVARYSSGDSSVFILDRSSGVPLLKFDDSPEVWVLQPTPGPRGDVIYKNDVGEPILRATRLGGLTLFSTGAPGGEAVAMVGGAEDLQPPPFMAPNTVFQHMLQASSRASRAAQHLITFDAVEVTPDTAPVFADAATAAAEAVITLSRRDDGRAFLRHLDKMQFQPGSRSGAAVASPDGGAHVHIQVFVDPAEGIAGRPSSERLVRAALAGK
jgi:hypothetical protein